MFVAVTAAPVLVTPTTALVAMSLRLPLLKLTYRPSSFAVRLLVKAYSTPPPTAYPPLLLLLENPKGVAEAATAAPATAAAGVVKKTAGTVVLKNALVVVSLFRSVKATPPVP